MKKINVKIAVGVGYKFTVVNASAVKDIELQDTHILVEAQNKVYPLYKGKTYEDSRKIDVILDNCENELDINACKIKS